MRLGELMDMTETEREQAEYIAELEEANAGLEEELSNSVPYSDFELIDEQNSWLTNTVLDFVYITNDCRDMKVAEIRTQLEKTRDECRADF